MKEMVCIKGNKKLDIKIYEASFFERVSGLMFKKDFNYGLLINGTNSIHTCFMFEIMDAIFLNKENIITKIHHRMKPWRVTRPDLRAKKVLELPGGWSEKLDIQEQMKLEFQYV